MPLITGAAGGIGSAAERRLSDSGVGRYALEAFVPAGR